MPGVSSSSARAGASPRVDGSRGVQLDGGGDALGALGAQGTDVRPQLARLLPRDWSLAGKRVLDFRASGEPPLPYPDQHFDLVCAISEFAATTDRWAEWLLELHRLVAPGGFVVVTFAGRRLSQRLAGEAWDEDRVGMNVLRRTDTGRVGLPIVLHSEWWVRAHWGRAFEIVTVDEEPELEGRAADAELARHTWALLRRRPVSLTAEDLERVEPNESREIEALRHNVRQLLRQRDAIGAEAEAELIELRESFHSELGRKSARLAHLEKVALSYRATLSWRITRPLRALRRILRSVRRS